MARLRDDLASPVSRRLAAGTDHSCGIDEAGALTCWGGPTEGALGAGPQGPDDPIRHEARDWPVAPENKFKVVGAYLRRTCAIDVSGVLWCWGENENGGLGDGTTDDRFRPVRVLGDHTWVDIGVGYTTCGVTRDGHLYCWGGATFDETGIGQPILAPVRVGGGSNWSRVAVGEGFVCAIDRAGQIGCWGDNQYQQLGNWASSPGTTSSHPLSGFESVVASQYHACAVRIDRSLWCWGLNGDGQLGQGSAKAGKGSAAARVPGQWKQATTGARHTCAIKTDGTLWCWGDNSYRKLGRTRSMSDAKHRERPIRVGLSTIWTAVQAGMNHTCAVEGGRVRCWGEASPGNSKLGDAARRTEPWSFEPLTTEELNAPGLRGNPTDATTTRQLDSALAAASTQLGSTRALGARLYEARPAGRWVAAAAGSDGFPVCSSLAQTVRDVYELAAPLALAGIDLWPERLGYVLTWEAAESKAPIAVSHGPGINADIAAAMPMLGAVHEVPLSTAGARLFTTDNGLSGLLLAEDYAVSGRIESVVQMLSGASTRPVVSRTDQCAVSAVPVREGLPSLLSIAVKPNDAEYEFRVVGQFGSEARAADAMALLRERLPRQHLILFGPMTFDPKRLQLSGRSLSYSDKASRHAPYPKTNVLFALLLSPDSKVADDLEARFLTP